MRDRIQEIERDMIRGRAREIQEALKPGLKPNPRRDKALTLLREWFPTGGTIYCIRRRKGKTGNMLIDCMLSRNSEVFPIGLTVADALERAYSQEHEKHGFLCYPNEMPSLFTGSLSMLLYGERGKIQVEML